jgi:hypothetical protein
MNGESFNRRFIKVKLNSQLRVVKMREFHHHLKEGMLQQVNFVVCVVLGAVSSGLSRLRSSTSATWLAFAES